MPHLHRIASNTDLRNTASQQAEVSSYGLSATEFDADAHLPVSLYTIPNHTFNGLEDLDQAGPAPPVSRLPDSTEPFPDFEEDVADLIEPAVQVHFRDIDWQRRIDRPASVISRVSPFTRDIVEQSWYDDNEGEDDDDALPYELDKQYADFSDYLNGVQPVRRRAIIQPPLPARLKITGDSARDPKEGSTAPAQSPRDSVPSPLLGRMQRCPYDMRQQRSAAEVGGMRKLRKGCSWLTRTVKECFGRYEATEMA
ncbi:hypothetical protein Tdes44962_MAKER08057 [Teratosphaeria destructans]|uniref:Uncharacterized protein n=1 Tax=Teratosphaeria destructans TaxID=418781 RepID=A0A9W7W4Z5_9PEZI|nr:hypothetical protein Tdes44962_MAKER08057 [Teratosphaeria destructans]